jgi:hypothetical protein
MSTPYGVVQVMDEIVAHLQGHPEIAGVLRVADLDDAPNSDPPMVAVGAPSWTYSNPAGGGVAEYTLAVYVVEAFGERALRDLLVHTDLVARVLDEPAGLAVKGGRPTSFPAGSQELPAYAIDLGVTA